MLLHLLLACTPQPEPFSSLQRDFFTSLAVRDPSKRAALPALEGRLDAAATAAMARAKEGATEDETGLILLYAGFVPHVVVHAVEDGYLPSANAGNLRVKMARSRELLTAARTLLPHDARIPVILRSVDFNLASFEGPVPDALVERVVDAAGESTFALFTALVLLRDPALYPMNSPVMERLLHTVCAPEQFGCDGPPPGAAEAPAGQPAAGAGLPENALTRALIGPVLVSDLLARRAEALLADPEPATAPRRVGEAMGRLHAARGFLSHAAHNLERPDLAPSPARDTLTARAARLDALLAATGGAPLPEADWYTSADYRVAYDCAACHTAAPGSTGVPK